jgi:hypothetical protein
MNPLLMRLPSPDGLLRLWATAREAFERETRKNPRVHFGFLAILAIVLLGLLFEIDDADRHAQVQIDADAQQLAVLRRLGGQTEWKARRESVQRLRVQLESRLWEAESDGLAQANFQDLISKFAKEAGVARIDAHVEIVNATATAQKYRQMSATVSGPFTAPSLQKFLADLDADEHMLIVDRLRIETAPVPRFEMLLSTYLRPTAAKPAAGATRP